MYLDFYNLETTPFHITPDPDFFFQSPTHREAWGSIMYGVKKRKGFIAITGEVGVGKTTVLRTYLDEGLRPPQLNTIYVFNANLSFQDLLKLLLRELAITEANDDIPGMVDRLHFALIEEYKQDRNVVLVIDEAQNMPVDTLENLRMLSNLETSKDKLIQIILVGQPEFEKILDLKELRQLRQRIAIRCEIKPLTLYESIEYITHRLRRAGQLETPIFSGPALKRIAKEAKGIPRLINILCDNALITGFGYQKKLISRKIVGEVISDLKLDPHRQTWVLRSLGISVTAFLASMIAFYPPLWKEILELKHLVFNSAQSDQHESRQTSSSTKKLVDIGSVATPSKFARPTVSHSPIADTPENVGDIKSKKPSPPQTHDTGNLGGPQPDSIPTAVNTTSPAASEQKNGGQAPVLPSTPQSPQTEIEGKRPNASVSQPQEGVPIQAITVKPEADSAKPNKDQETVTPQPKQNNESETIPEVLPKKRVVTKGDYLTKLVFETYGYVNDKLVEFVRQKNPHIRNINTLQIGDEINFPDISTQSTHESSLAK